MSTPSPEQLGAYQKTVGTHVRLAEAARLLALLAVILTITACGRTIAWEEEVPLNTGETIWIERSMPWELEGAYGNPLDIALLPTREQTIRFQYAGKFYNFTGRVGVMLIAISPRSNEPVLVGLAGSYGWHSRNHYFCVIPYYVQFEPDPTGMVWTWPAQIEPWLYGLRANVMANVPLLDERRHARYTATMRDERDATYRLQQPEASRIDANYKFDGCIVKN